MSRITRKASVGVRVMKVPQGINWGVDSSGNAKESDFEPRVINEISHRKFVSNIFAIRGRTSNIV